MFFMTSASIRRCWGHDKTESVEECEKRRGRSTEVRDRAEARRTWCPSRFTGVRRDASDARESPWRQLRERAEEIPGDKKHDPGLRGFSHGVIALRCSIQDRTIGYSTEWIAVFVSSDRHSVRKLPAGASRLGHPPPQWSRGLKEPVERTRPMTAVYCKQ